MLAFAATDLQRKSNEVQQAASKAPVFLTFHDKPKFVILSVEDFARLGGLKVVAAPEGLPDSVVERLRALAETYPAADVEFAGGLAGLMDEDESASGQTS
jgi:prevent-host-death family protein